MHLVNFRYYFRYYVRYYVRYTYRLVPNLRPMSAKCKALPPVPNLRHWALDLALPGTGQAPGCFGRGLQLASWVGYDGLSGVWRTTFHVRGKR